MGKYRHWLLFGFMAMVVMSFLVTAYFANNLEAVRREQTKRQAIEQADLCKRQHSLIEMQRLFLQEHENIRQLITSTGTPVPHHSQKLLDRLDRLIERSDCVVGVDVPKPESV